MSDIPVFPTPQGIQWNDGMFLRDYFAAKAMQALIAQSGGVEVRVHHKDGILILPAREAIPQLAYEYADKMLAERDQDGEARR